MRRRLLALAIVAVTVVGTAGLVAALTPATTNSHNRALVLFAGDSNITLAAQPIVWALTWDAHNDNGYVPVFAPRVGASIRTYDCLVPVGCTTTDYWLTRLGETLPKIGADAIVVNLGVNDTFSLGTETTPGYATYAKKINWFMAQVPSTTPVLWTNLPCPILPPARVAGCNTVDLALALAVSRWPNLVLVNWNFVAWNHPEYMVPNDIHLTSAGTSAWSNLVVQTLDARFPAP